MGFYVVILSISFSLFKCYEHPNGELSVQSAPNILCFREDWNQVVATPDAWSLSLPKTAFATYGAARGLT
eukprot:1803036-Alexandrium_andersonii.AAC.1